MDNSSALELYIKKFSDYDPVLSAHIIETMDIDESLGVFDNLPTDVSRTIFENLQNEYAAELLGKIDPETAGEILRGMEPLKISLIVGVCPMALKDRISHSLTEKQKSELREILEYPKDSVGYMMSTNFLALSQDLRLSDAVSKIRLMALKENTPLSYVYVVDSGFRLTGVLTMRDLLIQDPDKHLRQIMIKDVFYLNAFMEFEEAASIVARRNFFAVPVVDNTGVLVGIVNTSQLLSDAHEEYSADIQTLFGAGSEERPFSGTFYSLRKRLPWLNINLATAFLAAGVIALFEGVIARLTILAVFLPIVAGQGGNAGAQSLAVVMRGLVMREIPKQDFLKLFWKEGKLGFLNGILIGLVTGAVAWIWQGSPTLGIVIGLAMIINLVVAGLAGSMIPVGLKTLGFDPAQSSMIILTTVTDIVGFFAFLGLAALFFGL
ncbi:MAG: magnesium transporter [Candidatus Dadabacteria bacterium]|nr:magnesium transporter [Candidatus Dadabacteria bacterium]